MAGRDHRDFLLRSQTAFNLLAVRAHQVGGCWVVVLCFLVKKSDLDRPPPIPYTPLFSPAPRLLSSLNKQNTEKKELVVVEF